MSSERDEPTENDGGSERAANDDWLNIVSIISVITIFFVAVVAIAVSLWILPAAGVDAEKLKNSELFAGLNPAIRACYSTDSRIFAIVISVCFGIFTGVVYIFGTYLYKKFRDSNREGHVTFWRGVVFRLEKYSDEDLGQAISGFQTNESIILEKRNLFWSLFLRAALAATVVMTIAVLIVACKVEAQAGLPIITGVISFIIGQGSNSLQSAGPTIVVSHAKQAQRERAPTRPAADRPIQPDGLDGSGSPTG